jgi:GMP synthase (glutamine-hydrolysing)
MILIINVCCDRLNELEFVEPIGNILKKASIDFCIKHYLEISSNELNKADEIIICGTSLKDFEYLYHIDAFDYLKGMNKPILGICAGMQIIAKMFGCELLDEKMIGQHKVKIERQNSLSSSDKFYSYFLVTKIVKISSSFDVIATTDGIASIIKQRDQEVYGCLFHPEVLNTEIILNFCRIARS